MKELLFPTKDISDNDIRTITEIYNAVKVGRQAEFDFDFNIDFRQFHLFSFDTIRHFGPVIKVWGAQKSFYLVFVQVLYRVGTGGRAPQRSSSDYQLWGVMNLKNKYGHVFIKPETILDKIKDMVNPIDIDIPADPEFSKHFYVVATDEAKAASLLGASFRDCIKNTRPGDLMIEAIDDKIIIGDEKVIQTETAIDIVNFMNSLPNAL